MSKIIGPETNIVEEKKKLVMLGFEPKIILSPNGVSLEITFREKIFSFSSKVSLMKVVDMEL